MIHTLITIGSKAAFATPNKGVNAVKASSGVDAPSIITNVSYLTISFSLPHKRMVQNNDFLIFK